MVLTVSFSSATSPSASTVIFFERSPLATAVVTRAMLRTWSVRFEAMRLTLWVRSFQVPDTPSTRAWPPSLPSVPTSRATRLTSDENEESWSTIEFTTLPMRWNSPLTGRPSMVRAIFWLRSPSATVGRPHQVVDQGVDRLDGHRPRPSHRADADPLGHPAVPADDTGHALQLPRQSGVELNQLVEGGGNLGRDARVVGGHPDTRGAVAGSIDRLQQLCKEGVCPAGRLRRRDGLGVTAVG